MPITKTSYSYDSTLRAASERFFVGRVLRIEKTTETRNWSDTLDYSDFRTTECTWALVWLGKEGVPPRSMHYAGGRVIAYIDALKWDADQVRALEVHEQYAWVDCTNLFSDRNGFGLTAEVDSFDMQLLFGGPAMIDGVAAWEAFHAARAAAAAEEARKVTAEREAREAAEKAKKAERDAKKASKEALLKAAAEAQLVHAPKKGTVATVNGFTGKVIWTGVAKYYGKFNARVGLKDAKGNVQWIDAAHWAK